jgi:hypothetical protein
MRLKRSEYNIMQDVINENVKRISIQTIRINQLEDKLELNEFRDELEEY